MSSAIRWLHLSDFHVGKDSYEQQRLFAEILGEVDRWKSEMSFIPDYVFITGDIANKGLKKEYETFRRDFLTPLQNKFDAETVIIPVPGNHDVERPTTDTLDRKAPLAASSRFFDANREGKADRAPVARRFNTYKKLMPSSGMSPDWLVSNEGTATHTRKVAGVNIGVVGLNTAWLCKDDNDKDQLTPGYRLVEAALKKLEACQIRIVLGHHPLSWWHDSEETNIRRLFAQHHVIYLHGHKHKSEGRFEEGGVDQFLVLQAGAAFQARETEKWVNGFSWGELDPAAAEVRISPRYWINGEWPPDMSAITLKRRIAETDWWSFPLPGIHAQPTSMAHGLARLSGWMALDAGTMASFAREITPADARRFFDGAEPDWALAMSPHFPVREQAKVLLESVVHFKGEDRPQIALVRGPTAEGKSMVLRQIVVATLRANPALKVLWHQDDTARINVQAFEDALTADQPWLIATDHGDMIVRDLENLAQRLKRTGRGSVQLVIAAHDSDWKMANGDSVQWYSFARFEEARLSGLSKNEAKSLATTWHHFGASAFDPSLQGLTPDLLAEQLLQAAKDDGVNEGALFGALLTLRHGKDLRAHVRALLQKLNGMSLSSGGTVGDAFRLIAAMHAEGLDFLSSMVLQEVMGCDKLTLQRDVLRPMAAEAAASGGLYLRTRHRRVAMATLEACSDDGEDTGLLYVSLVGSAVRLRSIKNVWLQELENWNYSLTKHFFESGREDLAIRIAAKMLETVPDNSHYAVNLARLTREFRTPHEAIQVLQSVKPPKDNRAFWTEWGTACGMTNDFISNSTLHAFSISDDLGTREPTIENSKQALSGLAKAFDELHTQLGLPELYRARAGCAWLGLLTDANDIILKDHKQASANIGDPKDVAEGISWLCAGLMAALGGESLADSVAEKVGNPAQFKFGGLQKLLERIQNSKV
ncbi:MAG: hypothetical protein H6R01_1330 [Burkholderiaceae bacterium]|nr:hypothetical protein [Burkholderiaceae bacterium]